MPTSRRSSCHSIGGDGDQALPGVDRDLRLDRYAVIRDTGHRIVPHLIGIGGSGQLANGRDGPLLAIFHPRLDEVADGFDAILRNEFLEPAFAGAAGADLGPVVAIPDIADPNLLQPDADQVVLVLEILLNAHAGKMHALLIDRRREGQIGRRLGRPDVGVMRARQGPEQRSALEKTGTHSVRSA